MTSSQNWTNWKSYHMQCKSQERGMDQRDKGFQNCGSCWRLNKQTKERRRWRQRINKILDWILVCLQLLNLTLEATIVSAIFLINTVSWDQIDCAVHKTQPRRNWWDLGIMIYLVWLTHFFCAIFWSVSIKTQKLRNGIFFFFDFLVSPQLTHLTRICFLLQCLALNR